MTEEDILFRVKLDHAPDQAHPGGHQGQGQDHRRGHHGVLREEQEALRPARAPRPERHPHQDRGPGQRGQAASSRTATSFKRVAEGVLDRRGLQGAGRQAADVSKGQQEKALDEAVFKAEPGEVYGPVKTQFGYYVFEVDKVKKASQQSLEQAKERSATCFAPARAEGARRLLKDFREKYKDETELRRRLPHRRVRQRSQGGQDTGPASAARRVARRRRRRARPLRRAPHRRARRRRRGPRSAAPRAGSAGRRADAVAAAAQLQSALERLDEITRRLRARVPLGPRAGRALDRAAHGRGGLRAGRRRPLGRRRQAARRARRRALPGATSCRF